MWGNSKKKSRPARVNTLIGKQTEMRGDVHFSGGLHIDGKLTSGENIADIGGVKEAYVAYKAWEAEHGATAPVAEGLTNDQVFFVAWAQNWCTLATEGADRIQVASDPHSPGRFRAEGPLADFPAFWSAFSCSEGTAMHPKDACEVW